MSEPSQPQRSEPYIGLGPDGTDLPQPPATEQEWTPEIAAAIYGRGAYPFCELADAHNAALEKAKLSERQHWSEALAAERERYGDLLRQAKRMEHDIENACVENSELKHQLLAAQAAIAAYIKSNYNKLGDNFAALQNIDLSALDKHVASEVEPFKRQLLAAQAAIAEHNKRAKEEKDCGDERACYEIEVDLSALDDALAKVKS